MSNDETRPTELEIFFEKTPSFRTIHADGAWGGLTGQLGLHVAFFSESREPPESIVYVAEGAAAPEKPNSRTGRERVVRQIEVEVFMTLETARGLRAFLDDKIKEGDGFVAEIRAQQVIRADGAS